LNRGCLGFWKKEFINPESETVLLFKEEVFPALPLSEVRRAIDETKDNWIDGWDENMEKIWKDLEKRLGLEAKKE